MKKKSISYLGLNNFGALGKLIGRGDVGSPGGGRERDSLSRERSREQGGSPGGDGLTGQEGLSTSCSEELAGNGSGKDAWGRTELTESHFGG